MQTSVSTLLKRLASTVVAAILCLLTVMNTAYASVASQQIRQAAQTFALQKLAADGVKIGPLDTRLRLTACSTTLRVFLPRGAQSIGQSTLGVQCDDIPGWKIYVPVRLSQFARIVVAKQSLPKGTVIGPEDIEMIKQDLSQLRYGHFQSAEAVVGMQLKRPVRRGGPLSPGNLTPRLLVQRGDIVTIMAKLKGLTVRVKGSALADGYRGQAIRVKNQRSKRIVQAEVIGPGIVRVRL